MGFMLYNSLSNKIEEFKTIQPNKVTMYVCGPTVYNYCHIGNIRPVVVYDMLRSYLSFLGYDVTYVSNVTDIDDKIIQQAIQENKTEKEIASFYERAYFEAVSLVGSEKPDIIPHATDYIGEMIDFIQELIAKGYAYEVDGDVFFRVNRIKDYGCLSKQVSEDLTLGARISINEKKENPLDFSLWKRTETGIKWDSPFGSGRPGWHTECVVMNHHIFKGEIDIHGGGMDLKFPHHENEIAQSEALYNHHLARYWMHVGRVDFEGQKMSKSLHNVILVKDLANTRNGMIMRMILLFTPYRNNFSYSEQVFASFEKTFDKWQRAYKQGLYELQLASNQNNELDLKDIQSFKEYMNQDLNVQNVMMLIEAIVKELNVAVRAKDIEAIALKWNSLNKILEIMRISLFVDKMTELQLETYKSWLMARADKDFAKADIYRERLVEWNII